jgi:hypothetical protein
LLPRIKLAASEGESDLLLGGARLMALPLFAAVLQFGSDRGLNRTRGETARESVHDPHWTKLQGLCGALVAP